MVSFKVGLPSRPFTLNSRPRQGDYAPNLVDYIKEKYGFDLDARLARYLQKPDAPAEAEADRAAKLMAPRLTPQQRARVLVEQLQAAPSDALWDLLRKTPTPAGRAAPPRYGLQRGPAERLAALAEEAGRRARYGEGEGAARTCRNGQVRAREA